MEPLEIAVKMEIEGKEFYERGSHKCTEALGKALFSRLAVEEDSHAAKAREIASALRQGETSALIEGSFDKGQALNSIFAKARDEIEPKKEVASTEFEVIEIALEMEEKTRRFYETESANAQTDTEKQFFDALAHEERGHYLSLVDYREYLIDPVHWFAKSEHISLDGA